MIPYTFKPQPRPVRIDDPAFQRRAFWLCILLLVVGVGVVGAIEKYDGVDAWRGVDVSRLGE